MARIPRVEGVLLAALLARREAVPVTLVVERAADDGRFSGAIARARLGFEGPALPIGPAVLPGTRLVLAVPEEDTTGLVPSLSSWRTRAERPLGVVVGEEGRVVEVWDGSAEPVARIEPRAWPAEVTDLFAS